MHIKYYRNIHHHARNIKIKAILTQYVLSLTLINPGWWSV